MDRTAEATHIAEVFLSFDDWDTSTWSLGSTGTFRAERRAGEWPAERSDIILLTFMLNCVPLPVIQKWGEWGNMSRRWPARISSHPPSHRRWRLLLV